jgi:methionyl-tRNA formyltransferase
VSIMRLTAGLDAGPVCLAASEPIRADDTYGSLAQRLQGLSADLLIRALDERPPFAEQDEAGVTYAEKIGPQDRTLDLSRPAVENERIVRALTPHIGARIELPGGQFLGVRAARATDDSGLELLEVQPAGGRPMAYADYVRGHGAVAGAA